MTPKWVMGLHVGHALARGSCVGKSVVRQLVPYVRTWGMRRNVGHVSARGPSVGTWFMRRQH